MNGFNVGYHVENSYGAHGQVTAIENGAVHVRYHDRGGSWDGAYSAAWFRKYPGMLKRVAA